MRALKGEPRWVNVVGGGSTCPDGESHWPDGITARSSPADLPARCWRCDATIRLETELPNGEETEP